MTQINAPLTADLFSYPKRVLAHYFYPFPLSIDDQPPATDYYNRNYLSPSGEANKFLAQGGYLRARPLPLPVSAANNWPSANMQREVSMAIARGITGFTFDILNLADAMSVTGHLQLMLAAAQAVEPRFWIVPMLDLSALVSLTQAQAVALIASLNSAPSVARLPDGRMLISAFNATAQPLLWWQGVFATLNSMQVYVAFIPVLLGEPASNPLASVSHGLGGWGTATPAAASACPPCMMMPVLTQQFRPKDACFWEAGNFDAFVAGWMAAINGGAQYVQIVTWSDFAESGQVQPCTDATLALNIGTGFYDLTAYYAQWFATGVQPAITKDVLYWCYRRMPWAAAHPNQSATFKVVAPGVAQDDIQVLAFLSAPGVISVDGHTLNAPAGITSLKIATAPGNPVFALLRDGSEVFHGAGPVTIYGPAGIPSGISDLTYWSGSVGVL